MSKVLSVDHEKCIACRLCELACSYKHHGEFNPEKANIKVNIFTEECVFFPIMCMQCSDPSCLKVCAFGALTREEKDGVFTVRVNKAKCTGCKMCTLACPFGCINYFANYAQKCELCEGLPECVALCPTGALELKEASQANEHKRIALSQKLKECFKEVE